MNGDLCDNVSDLCQQLQQPRQDDYSLRPAQTERCPQAVTGNTVGRSDLGMTKHKSVTLITVFLQEGAR